MSMEQDDEETEQSEDESADESRPGGGFFHPQAVFSQDQGAEEPPAQDHVGENPVEAVEDRKRGAFLSMAREKEESEMEV